MGFISNNLMNEEKVVYNGTLHWIIFIPGAVVIVIGILCFSVPVLAGLLIIIGLIMCVGAYIKKITTEIAVTNKRLLGKTGLIRRDTIDLNLKKVESLYADQGIFARMLDYGTVRIVGTGGSSFKVRGVDKPIAFKKAANEQIDTAQA